MYWINGMIYTLDQHAPSTNRVIGSFNDFFSIHTPPQIVYFSFFTDKFLLFKIVIPVKPKMIETNGLIKFKRQ